MKNISDGWKKATGLQPEKQCEGENCLNRFRPTGPWGGRRCPDCKKQNNKYRDENSPF